jgi:predicted cobalt transporter CbtA
MTATRNRSARFARTFRRHAAVLALPVALLCGQQFWWSLVVAVAAVGIEIVRFLRSPPFMRVRIEPEVRDD